VFDKEEKINSIIKKVQYFYYKKDLIEAERYANEAYKLCVQIYGKNHIKTAETLGDVALFLEYRKEFKNSRRVYLKAIEINQSQIEPDIITLAAFNNGLAHTYRITGDYETAFSYFLKANSLAESINDESLPTHLYDFAKIQKITKKTKDANQTYQKSIATALEIINKKKKQKTTNTTNKSSTTVTTIFQKLNY